MFKHRFVSICLLLAYGIPAAVGPYWHNHPEAVSHHACSTECVGYAPDAVSGEYADESNCGVHCSCSEQINDARDRGVSTQAGSSPAGRSICWLHVCSDHCAICAFYAQSTDSLTQCDAPASCALWAWIGRAHASAEASPLRAFSARGPPAAVLSIA